ncbi:MAG: hypothetical protein J7K40_06480 [candidate division Zixibacteria bacterium]|nr:hypothetical protein [candidate division Zixibacteria bacterium]
MTKKNKFKDKILLTIFIYFIFILMLRLISSFFPKERLWGLNQAAFTDWTIIIYPVLFVLGLY